MPDNLFALATKNSLSFGIELKNLPIFRQANDHTGGRLNQRSKASLAGSQPLFRIPPLGHIPGNALDCHQGALLIIDGNVDPLDPDQAPIFVNPAKGRPLVELTLSLEGLLQSFPVHRVHAIQE